MHIVVHVTNLVSRIVNRSHRYFFQKEVKYIDKLECDTKWHKKTRSFDVLAWLCMCYFENQCILGSPMALITTLTTFNTLKQILPGQV